MQKQMINLSKLPLHQEGRIEEITCEGNSKRRLLDLGLVKGTSITPVLVSPSKDPRAFSVRGTIIAIRQEDANRIKITTQK
jgi:ferrous iron transport protein A